MKIKTKLYNFVIPLSFMLLAATGCQIYYPAEPFIRDLQPDFAALTENSSKSAKCKVAIFFIEDFDFCDSSGFRELNAQLRASGFNTTYFGYLYHTHYFAQEITRLSEKHPDMRFVVVGHGLGGSAAYWVAGKVNPVPVDLLITINCHEKLWGKDHANVVQNLHLPVNDVATTEVEKVELKLGAKVNKSLDSHLIITQIAEIAREINESKQIKETKKDKWDFLAPNNQGEKEKAEQAKPPRIMPKTD